MYKQTSFGMQPGVEASVGVNRHHSSRGLLRGAKRTANASETAQRCQKEALPFPVFLLLISLQLPWIIPLGPLRLTPYRLVLIVLLPMLLLRWVRGGAGPIRVTDSALLLLCVWCAIAMVAVHGVAEAIEPAGIYFIETIGGYWVARCYIRSAESFYRVARMLFIVTVALLPFALHETLTGGRILLNAYRLIMPTYVDVIMPQRWGLDRAQTIYVHPIHFGLNIGCTLTLTWMVVGYGKPMFSRISKAAVVFFTSFLSLSSGPLTSMVGQIGLMGWSWSLQRFPMKWSVMAAGGALVLLLTELFANRSLAVILISTFAFDEQSAYIRTLTWEYGTQSIMNHPLFGVGFNMWDKPDWLTPSIDMHWIIDSVRHGMLAGILTFTAFFSAVITIGRVRISEPKLSTYRAAYMFTMAGFFMTGWAVYFWESTFVLFMFLLGSGFWILDHEDPPAARKSARRHKIRHPSGVSANS